MTNECGSFSSNFMAQDFPDVKPQKPLDCVLLPTVGGSSVFPSFLNSSFNCSTITLYFPNAASSISHSWSYSNCNLVFLILILSFPFSFSNNKDPSNNFENNVTGARTASFLFSFVDTYNTSKILPDLAFLGKFFQFVDRFKCTDESTKPA